MHRSFINILASLRASVWTLGAAFLAAGALLAGCAGPAVEPAPALDPAALVQRGEYLTTVGGCHDCHTPWKMGEHGPEPDMSRALMGHPAELEMPPLTLGPGPWLWAGAATNTAFAGPWGISYATNLTPDAETGIGFHTEETFIQTLRSGKHMGAGRPILPPMPWPNYARMTDDDLEALFAYLQSVPAIRNRVPDPVLAAPPAE